MAPSTAAELAVRVSTEAREPLPQACPIEQLHRMRDTDQVLALLPDRFTIAEAAALGVGRSIVRRLLQHELLSRSRHGLYTTVRDDIPDARPWENTRRDHLARCADELSARPGHALSHVSAAVALGLPVLLHRDTEVHLTSIDRAPRSERIPGLRLHHCDSLDNDTVLIGGLRTTTLRRTLADVLRTLRPPNSVALVDHAVREGLVTPSQVAEAVESQRRWVGVPRARQAVRWVDPRRETWLESYSFVTFAQHGLPLPLAQVEVYDEDRTFVARLDGLYDKEAVALEADGESKYLIGWREDGLTAAQSTARALVAQYARHTRLESLGLTLVRWGTVDIRTSPDTVASRVRGALRKGDGQRFTGWFRRDGAWFRQSPH